MEKLIELLCEFWEYYLVEHNWEICKWTTDDETGEINIYTDYTNNIISKKFWFIEWLVENKKIDLYKLPIRLEEYYQNTEAVGYITDDESILLMELAIQDEPIEFLIGILK